MKISLSFSGPLITDSDAERKMVATRVGSAPRVPSFGEEITQRASLLLQIRTTLRDWTFGASKTPFMLGNKKLSFKILA